MTPSGSSLLMLAALASALLVACAFDLHQRRIPNVLSLMLAAAGLAWQLLASSGAGLFHPAHLGAPGLLAGFAGAALALTLGFIGWQLRFFGAGDAKLLAAIGAVLGWRAVPSLLLCVLICGGALGLIWIALRRARVPMLEGVLGGLDRLPYALAIAGGTLLFGVLSWRGTSWPLGA